MGVPSGAHGNCGQGRAGRHVARPHAGPQHAAPTLPWLPPGHDQLCCTGSPERQLPRGKALHARQLRRCRPCWPGERPWPLSARPLSHPATPPVTARPTPARVSYPVVWAAGAHGLGPPPAAVAQLRGRVAGRDHGGSPGPRLALPHHVCPHPLGEHLLGLQAGRGVWAGREACGFARERPEARAHAGCLRLEPSSAAEAAAWQLRHQARHNAPLFPSCQRPPSSPARHGVAAWPVQRRA